MNPSDDCKVFLPYMDKAAILVNGPLTNYQSPFDRRLHISLKKIGPRVSEKLFKGVEGQQLILIANPDPLEK